jgi:hypothetical protein
MQQAVSSREIRSSQFYASWLLLTSDDRNTPMLMSMKSVVPEEQTQVVSSFCEGRCFEFSLAAVNELARELRVKREERADRISR